MSRDKRNNTFCVSIIFLKDKDKPAHWVGHLELRSLDIYVFFKTTPRFDENEVSVTGNIR